MQAASPKVAHAFLVACVSGLALAMSIAVADEERDLLIVTWKLVSWQIIAEDGTPHDVFGASPKGYLVLTPDGRSIVVTTAAGRRAGMDDASRAALHKSMLAYSGRYRVEGNDFITTVEVSWNENGTERSNGAITGSKATSCLSSPRRPLASCFPARQTSGASCGCARSSGKPQGQLWVKLRHIRRERPPSELTSEA
jgi:hypothetical protein